MTRHVRLQRLIVKVRAGEIVHEDEIREALRVSGDTSIAGFLEDVPLMMALVAELLVQSPQVLKGSRYSE